jgi:hypothetical protein
MTKRYKCLLSLFVCLLHGGCLNSKRSLEAYGSYHIGREITDIIEDIGVPTKTFTIHSKYYYIWERSKVVTSNPSVNGYHAKDPMLAFITGDKEAIATSETEHHSKETEHLCKMMFRTNVDGIVESYGVEGRCDYGTSFLAKENMFERN